MKKSTIKVLILAMSLLILSLVLFFSKDNAVEPDRTSIILSKSHLLFSEVGQTAELSSTIIKNGVQLDSDETEEKIAWTSSNTDVATVKDGLVEVVGYGSCVIRASCEGFSSFCTVNNPNPNPPLSISADEVVLDNIGKKQEIFAISETGEDISSVASWRSSNESIAVCDDGVITAKGYGFCTITAAYNLKTAICIVTVKNPTAPSITLSADDLNLRVGESFTLTANTDFSAGDSVVWKSSDESVAACENGVVTAKKNGKCAIIAITELGYTDICIVSVGSTDNKNQHESLLKFDFPHIEKELLCIDRSKGQITASAVVIGYDMKTLLLEDGRLVVEISLICIKTYDKDGMTGTNPAMVTVSLYRENDAFCDKRMYKSENVAVGDTFTVKCSGFTVQTKTDGTARELYMTFSTITER